MNALALAVAVTCYQYGTITQCTDGTTAYKFGNQTQIISPNNEQTTIYQFGNQTQIDSNTPNVVLPPIQTTPSLRVLKPFD